MAFGFGLGNGFGLARPRLLTVIGQELLFNTEFDTSDFWPEGGGWSIAGGAALRFAFGSASSLSTFIPRLVNGGTYETTIVINSISGGTLTPQLFNGKGGNAGLGFTSAGTFKTSIVARADEFAFRLAAQANLVVSVNRVSLMRIA